MGCIDMPNSKDKGARFERQIVQAFKDNGFLEAHRSAQYCGQTGDAPDVAGVPGLHIECKHYKDTEWQDAWWQQAERDARAGSIPVVIHKTDRHKPKVRVDGLSASAILSMLSGYGKGILVEFELDDFINAYKQYDEKRWRPHEKR